MSLIGNILWLIFGGLVTSLMYFVAGLVMCVTIVGIPFGLQLFKFGAFALMPFGHEVGGNCTSGCLTLGFNVLWIFLGWWEIALVHVACGLLFCVTIVGIPFGLQHFKLAGYSLFPFGRSIQ